MVDTYTPGTQAVDLQNIPLAMVDHVEVLRDGASPIYGADAIAGMINAITKQDFAGLQVDAGGGICTYGEDLPLANDAYVQTVSNQYDFAGRYFISEALGEILRLHRFNRQGRGAIRSLLLCSES